MQLKLIKEGGGLSYFDASDMNTLVLKRTILYIDVKFSSFWHFFIQMCINPDYLAGNSIKISGSTRIDITCTCKLQARQDCLHRSQNLDVVELKQHNLVDVFLLSFF